MKVLLVVSSLFLVGFIGSCSGGFIPQEKCDPTKCVLPNCFCSGIVPPINPEKPHENPQIVYLTFDDAITITNYPLYQEIFSPDRKNPNGAHISGTFFVPHEYNNYSLTHQLWRQGHEIALHSITHKSDTTYWKNLNETMWTAEVIDQRQQMAFFAKIPVEEVLGFRAPFLQGGGDEMYEALSKGGIEYDSSRPSYLYSPNLWPYTMDYDSIQDCQISPCPKMSVPGFWVSPLVDLFGSNGYPCAFADTCLDIPSTKEETFDLLMGNFVDHYTQARAPYGVYIHAPWLMNNPWIREGYLKFLDHILSLGDAYVVSIHKALEWMRDPNDKDHLENFKAWQDRDPSPTNNCTRPIQCNYDDDQTPPGFGQRIMSSCQGCPPKYPWIHNHLGE